MSEDAGSEYEERVLAYIHEAMPWRARVKVQWRDYHRERLRAIFAVLDSTPTWDGEDVKTLLRKWL